jgi:hypothetical protein
MRREEGIAGSLRPDQIGQRVHAPGRRTKRFDDEFAHLIPGERRWQNALKRRVPGELVEGELQERRACLVPIGQHEQDVGERGARTGVHEDVQRCFVEPLQVVDEEHERTSGSGERSEHTLDQTLETVPGVLDRDLGDRGLSADQRLEVRQAVDQQLPVGADRLAHRIAKPCERQIVEGENSPYQLRERLDQRGVGRAPFVLVELTPGEQGSSRRRRAVQFARERRFSDPGWARDRHQLGSSRLLHAFESCKQAGAVVLPPKQSAREGKLALGVSRAQRERVDSSARAPGQIRRDEVGLEAARALVAILWRLGEEPFDDGGEPAG